VSEEKRAKNKERWRPKGLRYEDTTLQTVFFVLRSSFFAPACEEKENLEMLEAREGFEPSHRSFADCRVNLFATAPPGSIHEPNRSSDASKPPSEPRTEIIE
jgi:hypothetical protein